MTFSDILNQEKIVLVDFFATWCGPCQSMPPILEELKKRVGDRAKIVKIDVDKNPQVAAQYQIRSVPTLLLFHNGVPVWRQSGVLSAAELEKQIQSYK